MNREHSSAGSEHLPYKQGVTGSNPVAPTKIKEREKHSDSRSFIFVALKQLERQRKLRVSHSHPL